MPEPGLHAPRHPAQSEATEAYDPAILTVEHELMIRHQDKHPLIMVLATEQGLMLGARRDADAEHYYWRMNHMRLPFYVNVPGVVGSPLHCNVWQPLDDANTMVWRVCYRTDRPWTEGEEATRRQGARYLPPTTRPGSRWLPTLNRSNDYGLDHEVQRTTMFSGIPGIWLQDRACTEEMGAIMDRTQEHLGPSDVAVIQMRRLLIRAAKILRQHGTIPPGVESGEAPLTVPFPISLTPRSQSWEELAAQHAPRRTEILVGT